jgi:hypothetical protein
LIDGLGSGVGELAQVGGRATPAARRARLAAGRGGERRRKRLPSCSTSLARSCRDWHQLLEICALFDTLIADADGVYDPANYNDRLLLRLKRTAT